MEMKHERNECMGRKGKHISQGHYWGMIYHDCEWKDCGADDMEVWWDGILWTL